jgi:hypothetical protein
MIAMRPVDPYAEGGSLRLRIRRGMLARSLRDDPSGPIEAREPDELFDPVNEIDGRSRREPDQDDSTAARCA